MVFYWVMSLDLFLGYRPLHRAAEVSSSSGPLEKACGFKIIVLSWSEIASQLVQITFLKDLFVFSQTINPWACVAFDTFPQVLLKNSFMVTEAMFYPSDILSSDRTLPTWKMHNTYNFSEYVATFAFSFL